MMLVIASGALGIWAYATLPQRLHGNRGETTRKQMLEAIESLDRQLHDLAQPLDRTGRYGDCANLRAMARLRSLPAPATPRQAEALARLETVMQQKADVLGLARRQMQITAFLEGWLFVHIPATFALLAALIAHIVSVFAYW